MHVVSFNYEISKSLSLIPGIVHGFFHKPHDFSLNSSCEQNRQNAAEFLCGNNVYLVTAKLEHSNKVTFVEAPKDVGFGEQDALVTTEKFVGLAITYADCLPILLASQDGQVVAAIHAGWRGMLLGIIPNTLKELFKRFPQKKFLSAIGPCISTRFFTVGEEVAKSFRREYEDFVIDSKRGVTIDLFGIAQKQLQLANVTHVDKVGGYTDENDKNYYSFRKTATKKRHFAIIARC